MKFKCKRIYTIILLFAMCLMSGAPLDSTFATDDAGGSVPPVTVNWADDHTLIVNNFVVMRIQPLPGPEGGFILSGYEPGRGEDGSLAALAAHITPAGETAWLIRERVEHEQSNRFTDIVPLGNGDLLIVNEHYTRGEGTQRTLTRIRDGMVVARETMEQHMLRRTKLFSAADGYFVYAEDASNTPFLTLYRFDEEGNLLWSREYPKFPFYPLGMLPVGDDYYVYGVYEHSQNFTYPLAMRINSEGKVLWNDRKKQDDYACFDNGIVMPDGGLLVVGDASKTAGNGKESVIAASFTAKGKAVWRKKFDYGMDDNDQGRHFCAVGAVDNGYLVVGGQTGGGYDLSKLYFFLFNGKGKITRQWWERISPLKEIDAVSLHQTPQGLCLVARGLVDEKFKYKADGGTVLSRYKDTVIRWLDIGNDGNDGTNDKTGIFPGMFTEGWEAKSATLNERMATRTGPGSKFTEDHGTLPQDTEIVVYAKEVGGSTTWALVEFVKNGKLVRAYTGMKRIDTVADDIRTVERPQSAKLTTDTASWYGPGEGYLLLPDQVKKGTSVQVYGIDRGFALIEYAVGDAWTRSWVPEETLAIQ